MFERVWYAIRWYDADEQEHYYAGTTSFRYARQGMESAMKLMPNCTKVRLYKNDSLIMEVKKDVEH